MDNRSLRLKIVVYVRDFKNLKDYLVLTSYFSDKGVGRIYTVIRQDHRECYRQSPDPFCPIHGPFQNHIKAQLLRKKKFTLHQSISNLMEMARTKRFVRLQVYSLQSNSDYQWDCSQGTN